MKYVLYILAALGAGAMLVLFLVSRGKAGALPDLKREFRRIDAESEAKKLQKKLGTQQAVQKIKDTHKEKLDALEDHQREEADRLSDNPVALSRWLADL